MYTKLKTFIAVLFFLVGICHASESKRNAHKSTEDLNQQHEEIAKFGLLYEMARWKGYLYQRKIKEAIRTGRQQDAERLVDKATSEPLFVDFTRTMILAAGHGYVGIIKNFLKHQNPISLRLDQCDEAGITPLMAASRSGDEHLVSVLLDATSTNPKSISTMILQQSIFFVDRNYMTALDYSIQEEQRASGHAILDTLTQSGYLDVFLKFEAMLPRARDAANKTMALAKNKQMLVPAEELRSAQENSPKIDAKALEKLNSFDPSVGSKAFIVNLMKALYDITGETDSAKLSNFLSEILVSMELPGDQLYKQSLNPPDRVDARKKVEQLIAEKVDINFLNNSGNTPISAAMATGNTPVVQMLLDYGADVFIPDHGNRTAFDDGIKHPECIKIVLTRVQEAHALDDLLEWEEVLAKVRAAQNISGNLERYSEKLAAEEGTVKILRAIIVEMGGGSIKGD